MVGKHKRRRLRGFDLRQVSGHHGLLGVDEAGRGALAGPVVAGAVLVTRAFLEGEWCRRHASAINDSKQLSAEERERIFGRLEWLMSEHRLLFATGQASVPEIEAENILGATRLAMRRAIENVLALGQIRPHPPDPLFHYNDPVELAPGQCVSDWLVLVDGKPVRGLGFEHHALVEGDARSLAVALASIVAKVTRDRLMTELDVVAPDYGLARHKGYATPAHREALVRRGPTPHHREMFVRTFLALPEDAPGQGMFDFVPGSEDFPSF